jgi:glycosyltransferase involved in cell wall biosynthesis
VSERPLVSVLLAARNAERFIDNQIACVLAQRGPSLELLMCDDASSDATCRRMQAWAGDPRVTVVRNRVRRFPAGARNRLLALARGEYCSPCDADDLLLPGALAALAAALARSPRAGVAYGTILQSLVHAGSPAAPRLIGIPPSASWDLFENRVNHGGCLIRTRALRAVGGYDASLRLAEDWDLFQRLSERCEFVALDGRLTTVWLVRRRSRSRIRRGRYATLSEIVRRAARRRLGVPRFASRAGRPTATRGRRATRC